MFTKGFSKLLVEHLLNEGKRALGNGYFVRTVGDNVITEVLRKHIKYKH